MQMKVILRPHRKTENCETSKTIRSHKYNTFYPILTIAIATEWGVDPSQFLTNTSIYPHFHVDFAVLTQF